MSEVLAELKKGFEDFKAENKKAIDAVNVLVKESENGTREGVKQALAKAEEAAKKVTEVSDRLLEAEQKLVSGIAAGKQAPKSLGQLVTESDEYKAFSSRKMRNMEITVQMNTITGQAGSPAENSEILVGPHRIPGIIPGAFRRLRIKDVILPGQTSSNIVKYTREKTFTNNAAERNEGVTKPESVLEFEQIDAPVATIAHFIKASEQLREDAPLAMSYINARMIYGVELKEEQQIVAGNGSNPAMLGMTGSGMHTAFNPATGDNQLDSINKAIYAIIAADYYPTAIVLNPADWGAIERLKVGSSDDRYIVGDPKTAMGPILWGLPVVVSNSMTSGKLFVAAFDIAFQYFQRSEVRLEITNADGTDFQKNLLTIRAEKRGVLAGYVPAATRYGSLVLAG
jgi:HK97 family phage major capsid protein